MRTLLISIGYFLIAAAIVGSYFFPKQVAQIIGGSATGTTFTTVRQAAIVFPLTSTSTSILNPFGQTVYVRGSRVGCNTVGTSLTAFTGTGLASLTMTVGTTAAALSSASAPFTPAARVASLTIATSTPNFLIASSTTDTATSGFATVWGASDYMSFVTNATNTAICTVGVEVLGQ